MRGRHLTEGTLATEFNLDYSDLQGKRVILACPTMGNIAPLAARHLRIAMMNASNHGLIWAGDASVHRGTIVGARNAVIEGALERDCDGVFWCDDDVTLPPEAISMLVATGEDFVCGVYCQRSGNMWPLIARLDPKGEKKFQWCAEFPKDVLAPMDGCGFGCVYTSKKLLQAVGLGGFDNKDGCSEDLSFALRAKEAGFQLWVLTAVLCGHLPDPTPVTYETFRKSWDSKTQAERDDMMNQFTAKTSAA